VNEFVTANGFVAVSSALIGVERKYVLWRIEMLSGHLGTFLGLYMRCEVGYLYQT